MSKRTFFILLGVSFVLAGIGISLICSSSTPYLIYSMWLRGGPSDNLELYRRAVEEIGTYTTMLYSGIVLVTVSGISIIASVVKWFLSRKEKKIPADVIKNLD